METVENVVDSKKEKSKKKNIKVKSKKEDTTKMGKNEKSTTNKKGLLNTH